MEKIKGIIFKRIEDLGRGVIESVAGLGSILLFTARFFYWVIRPPYRLHLFFEQLFFIGNKSLSIVILSGLFTGMVMATQTYFGSA